MPKTTVSKKRNRSQEKNKRSRNPKARKQRSRKNSPLPTNQKIHLRNEFEFSSKRFLGEYSDKRISGQDLRPNIHPIYHGDSRVQIMKLVPSIVGRKAPG